MLRSSLTSTLFPYTTLFRSNPTLRHRKIRISLEQSAPVLIGIFSGRVSEFIDEGLQEKLVLRSAHRCPRPGRDLILPIMIVEQLVPYPIRQFVQASDGLLIA